MTSHVGWRGWRRYGWMLGGCVLWSGAAAHAQPSITRDWTLRVVGGPSVAWPAVTGLPRAAPASAAHGAALGVELRRAIDADWSWSLAVGAVQEGARWRGVPDGDAPAIEARSRRLEVPVFVSRTLVRTETAALAALGGIVVSGTDAVAVWRRGPGVPPVSDHRRALDLSGLLALEASRTRSRFPLLARLHYRQGIERATAGLPPVRYRAVGFLLAQPGAAW